MKISHLFLPLAALACVACASPADKAWSELYPQIEAKIVAPTFPDRNFDIRDFGAQPEEACHEAINAAIRACNAEGGGHVIVPAGQWLSGAITLLSNVDLHLEEGATILFSDDLDHYPMVRTRWEGMDCYNYSPMIYANNQENIAVTGLGTLDGGASVKNWWAMCWNLETDWEPERRASQKVGRPLLKEWLVQGKPVEERLLGHPTWLAPVQAKILPITDAQKEYAREYGELLRANGVSVEVDDRNEKIGYKIREAQLEKVPYMLIVGEKEVEAGAVAVRSRKNGDLGQVSKENFIADITKEIREKIR